MKNWSVYMLLCSDGSLYTGITTDVDRRVKEHNSGKGSKYVRSRRPAELVWREDAESRSGALRREAEIKSLSRTEKEALVEGR
jgi:putative endonuclease